MALATTDCIRNVQAESRSGVRSMVTSAATRQPLGQRAADARYVFTARSVSLVMR
jgi:hypothetical protein